MITLRIKWTRAIQITSDTTIKPPQYGFKEEIKSYE